MTLHETSGYWSSPNRAFTVSRPTPFLTSVPNTTPIYKQPKWFITARALNLFLMFLTITKHSLPILQSP